MTTWVLGRRRRRCIQFHRLHQPRRKPLERFFHTPRKTVSVERFGNGDLHEGRVVRENEVKIKRAGVEETRRHGAEPKFCRYLLRDLTIAGLRINEGGHARFLLGDRSIHINNSISGRPRTGSIEDGTVRTELLAPENRFTLEIRRVSDDAQRIQAIVNGVLVNEWNGDPDAPNGRLAIEVLEPDTRLERDALQWKPGS